jgi:hypothetical protein
MGICTGIGLAYLLSATGGGPAAAAYIAHIFLPNDLVRVWLLSLGITLVAGIFPATNGKYHYSQHMLIIPGLYQFSSLKTKCLRYCESPLSFFMRR